MPPVAAALPAILPYAIPGLLGIGTSVLGGMMAGNRAGEAEDAWRRTAFPSKAAVNAQALQNRGQLGQARLGAYQDLSGQMAARGFGSGSGQGMLGASNIERGYLQNLANANTELTKFKNTPMFGPPSAIYPSTGGAESGFGTAGSLLNKAAGFYMAKNLFGGIGTGGGGGYGSSDQSMLDLAKLIGG